MLRAKFSEQQQLLSRKA